MYITDIILQVGTDRAGSLVADLRAFLDECQRFVCLCVCVFVCVFVCLFVCVFVCMSVSLSVHLFVCHIILRTNIFMGLVLFNGAVLRNQKTIDLFWDDTKLQTYLAQALRPMVSTLLPPFLSPLTLCLFLLCLVKLPPLLCPGRRTKGPPRPGLLGSYE